MLYVLIPLALYALYDLYWAYRFIRRPQVDSTAGFLWWLLLKHHAALHTHKLVRALPWISKDLTEAFGGPDDGRVT